MTQRRRLMFVASASASSCHAERWGARQTALNDQGRITARPATSPRFTLA
jgi:hypothetical protein